MARHVLTAGACPCPPSQSSLVPLPTTGFGRRLHLPRAIRTRRLIGAASVAAMVAHLVGDRCRRAWCGQTCCRAPPAVWDAAVEVVTEGYRGTTLWQNVAATLGRLLSGFVLAVIVIGVPLGLWMGTNRLANAGLDWIVQFMRPLPPLSYMILLILWLGTGNLSKAALLFLTAFPIIVAASGVRRAGGEAAAHPGGAGARVPANAPRCSATWCCRRPHR